MLDLSYLKLGFTIFISVLLAGLLLFFIEQRYYSNVLNDVVSSISKSIASIKLPDIFVPPATRQLPNVQHKTTSQIIKLQQENRKQHKKLRDEALARKSIQQTNNETCAFWRERYRKNKSEYNKVNLDSACTRAAND